MASKIPPPPPTAGSSTRRTAPSLEELGRDWLSATGAHLSLNEVIEDDDEVFDAEEIVEAMPLDPTASARIQLEIASTPTLPPTHPMVDYDELEKEALGGSRWNRKTLGIAAGAFLSVVALSFALTGGGEERVDADIEGAKVDVVADANERSGAEAVEPSPSAQPAGNAEQPAPQAGTEAQEEEVGKVVEAEEQAPSLPLSYAPRIVDRKGERLQVKELTLSESVGRTRCGDERAHFELKKDSEIALCFLVERTVRGRLRILWEREGVTERRSLFRIAPAKRFRSRAELKLRSGYEGSWTARIMKDNEELAAIDFRIE